MLIGKVWTVDISVTVVCMCVCTVTYFSGEDKANGVKFARWFIGVLGRESPILGNVEYRAACGRRIGMCGYACQQKKQQKLKTAVGAYLKATPYHVYDCLVV